MNTKRKTESNSWSLNRPRIMKSGDPRTDSERDSGFSDASSEHMSTMDNTDSEDSPRPFVKQGSQTSGSGARPSQLAVVGGSYSSLSPMIIMNNVLLKQPGDSPPALKPWGFSPTVDMVQPVVQQPQVVFLQPMVSRQTSSAHKEITSRHKRQKKYLPILKSYPKIAPHPGDSSTSSGRGTASLSSPTSSCSSYSSSSGSKKGSSVTSNHREHGQREKLPSSPCSSVGNSSSTVSGLSGVSSTMSPLLQNRLSFPTTEASESSSPTRERPPSTVSQSEFITSLSFSSKNQTLPSLQAAIQEHGSLVECDPSDADTRRKRFCNTYNILSKSGLLDITLRTKELLKQNRHTQNDIDRLKQHTDLFLQALRSGDISISAELQASLQEEDGEKGRETPALASLEAD